MAADFVLERIGRVINRFDLFVPRALNVYRFPDEPYLGAFLGFVQFNDTMNSAITGGKRLSLVSRLCPRQVRALAWK